MFMQLYSFFPFRLFTVSVSMDLLEILFELVE